MIEELVTDKWQSMKEIARRQKELGIRDSRDIRRFRKEVQRFNALYDGQGNRRYVVHRNGKGYKWAADEQEIKASVADLSKRAVTMLRAANAARRAIGMSRLERLELEPEEREAGKEGEDEGKGSLV